MARLRSLLRPAGLVAAVSLAGTLTAYEAGWLGILRVRRTIAVVQPEVGLAFVSPTGEEWPERTFAAPFQLFEDGRSLGAGYALRREIRKRGGGRYGFFGRTLYFSSSDGSDPRTNGRRYHYEGPWPLSRRAAIFLYALLAIAIVSLARPWLSRVSAIIVRWKECQCSIPRGSQATVGTSIASHLTLTDAVAASLFCAIAAALFVIHASGEYPFLRLGSDAAQIASFAAARDHPELFQNDALLGDPDNYRFYAIVHVPLLQRLTALTGDYGTSFLWLLGPTVFLQLLGFYWLGRMLYADRFWALLLALVSSATTMFFGGSEFWGLWADSLPRNLFQAVLPWALLLVLRWHAVPGAWPLIMAGLGSLMYLHPVSAPAWGAAVWVGLSVENWEWSRSRISRLLLSGMVFVLVAGTFLWVFSRHQVWSSAPVIERARELQDRLYGFERASPLVSYPVLLELYSAQRPLLLAGLAGVVLLWRMAPPEGRWLWRLALMWLVVILLISVGLPVVIQVVGGNPHTSATQRVLVRCLRFLFPMVFIQCLWALLALERASRSPGARCTVLGCGLLLSAVWLHANPPMLWPQEAARWGRSGERDTLAVLQGIRERTPPTARILCYGGQFDPSTIRYFSRRSLAYCYKDFGVLGQTNDLALLQWAEAEARYDDLKRRPRDSGLFEAVVGFARELRADHLLVYRAAFGSLSVPADVVPVYENGAYSLFRLKGVAPGR
jgi:hypothetical protein